MQVNHHEVISFLKNEISKNNYGRLIHLTLSGSELYGISSKDSDLDYRGTFIMDTDKFLGIHSHKDTYQVNEKEKLWDCDIFEIGKTIGLAIRGNCNVWEHIMSDAVFTTSDYLDMKGILVEGISKKGLYDSYKGMAETNYNKFILDSNKTTAKKYLYVFRSLLAGIHVLQEGYIEPNIVTLIKKYGGNKEIEKCIRMKQEGTEWEKVKRNEKWDMLINKLFLDLNNAYERSDLPERTPPEVERKLNSLLINLRKE